MPGAPKKQGRRGKREKHKPSVARYRETKRWELNKARRVNRHRKMVEESRERRAAPEWKKREATRPRVLRYLKKKKSTGLC